MRGRITSLFVALTLSFALASIAPRARAATTEEHWKGTITLPNNEVLGFVVHFQSDDSAPDRWIATLDVPLQGVAGAKMAAVTYGDQEIAFSYAEVGAIFQATINEDGQTATGTLQQSGLTMPIELQRRTDEQLRAEMPKRPQTPQPPFPYEAIEVTYKNEIDGVTIAGTLTIPKGDGPFPAVVMITGSGGQNRDEELFSHKPFLVIADHLSRHGIAVLRADDRGMGDTGGNIAASTSENFALDALAGVNFLKTVDKINPTHIGMMGHSEGGIIGPMAASKSKDVAFVVMLAGTGLPGSEILAMQSRLLLEASGILTPEELDEIVTRHHALTAAVMSDAPRETQIQAMIELSRAQGATADDEALAAASKRALVEMHTPWFRFFLAYDPRPTLRQVTCPVLALNGSLDLQVPADKDLAEIRKALTEAGNKDFTITKLDGLNHLFQHATTGSIAEYPTIEETFAPDALDLITEWINTRFGIKAEPDAPINELQ